MSTLVTNKIVNPIDGNTLLKSSGSIIQVARLRNDVVASLTSAASSFSEITQTRITITPKSASSRLIIQWEFVGEPNDHNTVMRIYRDGAVISTAGEQGYNNSVALNNWVGWWTGFYDQDNDSTANKHGIIYSQISGSTASRNYSLAFGGSDGGGRTLRYNACLNSPGQTNREVSITTGVIYEIAP